MKPGFEKEEAIIGSILADPLYSVPRVRGTLEPSHFRSAFLADLYKRLLEFDGPIDPVVALDWCNQFDRSYLAQIIENFPGAVNIEHYRDMVIKDHLSRQLTSTLTNALKSGVDENAIKQIERDWRGIQSLGARQFDLESKAMQYVEELEQRGKNKGDNFKIGFPVFDYKIPLFRRGEVCVVAGRPGLGKTSLCIGATLALVESGKRVLYASGEMSFNQIMDRIVSQLTGIPLLSVRKGDLEGHYPSIISAVGHIAACKNLFFVEAAKLSFRSIVPVVIHTKPDVLVVDYIQRFSPDGKIENRAAFYSDVANGLKGLSLEHKMVVIAASQLNRELEHQNRRPVLADLKESGGIEEAADVVWALHRDKEALVGPDFQKYQMLILKNRNGPTLEFSSIFNETTAMFREEEKSNGQQNNKA